jgi:hypothetical protein
MKVQLMVVLMMMTTTTTMMCKMAQLWVQSVNAKVDAN